MQDLSQSNLSPLNSSQLRKLSDVQELRYCRHILLPQMDFDGQEKLLNAKVLVIGLGGLGAACVPYLSSAGVGELTLVDFDKIELTNLQRQVIYQEQDLDQYKAEVSADFVRQQNSDCVVRAITEKLSEHTLSPLVENHDVVVDCTDNLATREVINKVCFEHKTPLVSGAAIRFEGQLTTFTYQENTPCYHCFSHVFSEQQLSCVESGVIAPLVGTIGTMQALEVIKLISGIGDLFVGRLYYFDGLSGQSREFGYKANVNCPVCGG